MATIVARREQTALVVFGAWMMAGGALDGWAHINNKPESFWTPWHAVIYSGFAAMVLFFLREGRRRGTGALAWLSDDSRRVTTVGIFAFGAGAVGDMTWHEVFGVEVDLEAVFSPTHVLLLVAGFLVFTAPLRMAWRTTGTRPSMREFWPAVASITIAVGGLLLLLHEVAPGFGAVTLETIETRVDEGAQVGGIAGVLVSTTLLMGPALWLLRRWLPPPGTFTVLFAGMALFGAAVHGFEQAVLVLPALAAGIVADVLAHRMPSTGTRLGAVRVFGAVVPLVMWSAWFGIYHLVWGVGWPVELWSGAILLAALTGLGLTLLTHPQPVPATAEVT